MNDGQAPVTSEVQDEGSFHREISREIDEAMAHVMAKAAEDEARSFDAWLRVMSGEDFSVVVTHKPHTPEGGSGPGTATARRERPSV